MLEVFIHIPKTGGKSIESLLFSNYNRNKIVPVYRTGGQDLSDVFSAYPQNELLESELIYGHIPLRIDGLVGRPCSYFTVLRDPVARFLSFYRFVKYDFDVHPLHHKLQSGEKTIKDIIGPNHPESNIMTKLLAGCDIREKLDPEMLGIAIQNLDRMVAFGIHEEFNASCLVLAKRLKWRMPFYRRTNVSSVSMDQVKETGEITDEILDKIKKAQYLDMKLYAYACNKFKEVKVAEDIDEALVEHYSLANSLFQSSTDAQMDSCACVISFLEA